MFSPSVIAQIVSTIHNRRDLFNLALIDDFHDAATARLYFHIALSSPTRAIQLCNSIVASASYATGDHDPQHPLAKLYMRRKELSKYVKGFVFSQDWSRSASMFAMDAGLDPDLGASFWSRIRSMLVLLPNLQFLALVDATGNHSFIFDHPEEFPFRLSDVRIRFAWDERLATFLKIQESLKALTIPEGAAKRLLPGMRAIASEPLAKVLPGTGKNIVSYEGPIAIARDLSASKLSSVQSLFPTATPQHLHTFISRNRHLRSLTLYETPEERVEWVLALIAVADLPLTHLGVLAVPLDRSGMHGQLSKLRLTSLDLDMRHMPATNMSPQKALCTELRTFCPTLNCITFYTGQSRARWVVSREQWPLGGGWTQVA